MDLFLFMGYTEMCKMKSYCFTFNQFIINSVEKQKIYSFLKYCVKTPNILVIWRIFCNGTLVSAFYYHPSSSLFSNFSLEKKGAKQLFCVCKENLSCLKVVPKYWVRSSIISISQNLCCLWAWCTLKYKKSNIEKITYNIYT